MYKEVKKSLKAAGGTAKWRELCEVLYDSATCISLSLLLRNDDDKEVPLLGRPHTPPAAAEAGAEAATEAATEAAAAEAAAAEAAAAEAATTDAVEVAAEAKAAEAAEAEAVKAAAEAEAAEEAFYGGEGAAAHAGGGTGILCSTPSLLAHSLPSTEITLTSLQREERERHSCYAAALSGPASSGGIPPPARLLPSAAICDLTAVQQLSLPSWPPPPRSSSLPPPPFARAAGAASSGGRRYTTGSPLAVSTGVTTSTATSEPATGGSSLTGSGVTSSEGRPLAALS